MKKGIKQICKEFKRVWIDFHPRITYKAKEDKFILGCMYKLDKVNAKHTWAAINPVIYSLNELKKNTWDKSRVEQIQKWLIDNFKVQ